MTKEGLENSEVILKKSYLQICQVSTEASTNFKYEKLADLLNVSIIRAVILMFLQIDQDDVEEWAIEAIQAGIIDAKIDQLNEEVVIKTHMMGKIGNEEWQAIHAKIANWKMKFQRIHDVLDASRQVASIAQEESKVSIA